MAAFAPPLPTIKLKLSGVTMHELLESDNDWYSNKAGEERREKYYLKGFVDKIYIDNVENSRLLWALIAACFGPVVITRDVFDDVEDYDKLMILIFTDDSKLIANIHETVIHLNNMMFLSYKSTDSKDDFKLYGITHTGGHLFDILNIAFDLTYDSENVNFKGDNRKINDIINSLINYDVEVNQVNIEYEKPKVFLLGDSQDGKYNLENAVGKVIFSGTFEDIHAFAVEENAEVSDKEKNLLIELGGKIVARPDNEVLVTASGTNKKSKKTKKAKKSKAKKAKKSKAKKSKAKKAKKSNK